MRPFGFVLLVLLPSVSQGQADSGTVRVTYELVKGDRVSATYDQSRTAGSFPLVATSRSAPPRALPPGRTVARPMRLVGCNRNTRRGTYTVEFDATIGPDGPKVSGPPGAQLTLQVGGYPWDRSVRYAGAGTYPQHFTLGPKKTAKAWLFRPEGKRMWDQSIRTAVGAASVTVNPDERSGSFIIGPYSDPKGQPWTVRGTFVCSRLMAAGI